ncbi:MAG: ankyrin repeat domain-containing protein [Bacillota bacterium]|jgi:ankyrin repeat protein
MEILNAVKNNECQAVRQLLQSKANPNVRDKETGLTLLMLASGAGNSKLVKILLDGGADVGTVDSKAGATALHKACQGGNLEVVKLLVAAGAFIDASVCSTGHTPLVEALWFQQIDIVEYLLSLGAKLNINTHYGFTLEEHLDYALRVNVTGKEKLLRAKELLQHRKESDNRQVEKENLMDAVIKGDLAKVKQLLKDGAKVDERYPILGGFNDAHTPLLVACRENKREIVLELLNAGADVNAVEPVFGAVSLHKATYNGHVEITKILAAHPGVNIDYQGLTNWYTPLHDALWHGFAECADVLINAGAHLDLKGHDGKRPVDIAREKFAKTHFVIKKLVAAENGGDSNQRSGL